VPAEVSDAQEQSAKLRIAFRLKCFLQCIEVQHQSIGADHIDEAPTLIYPDTSVELHCTDVRKDKSIWSMSPHIKCGQNVGPLQKHPSRSDSYSQAKLLSDNGKRSIDRSGLGHATRHARDKKRRGQVVVKDADSQIDPLEIQFWERLVNETVLFETIAYALRGNILLEIYPNVFRFSRAGTGPYNLSRTGFRHCAYLHPDPSAGVQD
jgi:hypothetical protein